MQRFQALSAINKTFLKTRTNSVESSHSRCQSLDIEEGKDDMSSPNNAATEDYLSRTSSSKSLRTDNQSWISDQTSSSDMLTDCPSSGCQVAFS